MVALTPSSLERWLRCPREYLLRDILSVPPADGGPPASEGLLVHRLLCHIHQHGSCRDAAFVHSVLDAHCPGDTGRIRSFVDGHLRRCPDGATPVGHEHELARFCRRPGPIFMVTGRIDAVWSYGDVLDGRDYKTGAPRVERVADDPVARVHAWLLAPEALKRGARVRIRYEHLAPEITDDPEPFEPDTEQLDAIGEEIRLAVEKIRAERTFTGVGEVATCRFCAYRSVCRDSAVTGPPAWVGVDDDLEPEPEPW
jgi:hypothetical protein